MIPFHEQAADRSADSTDVAEVNDALPYLKVEAEDRDFTFHGVKPLVLRSP
jgi:hypothetical protein